VYETVANPLVDLGLKGELEPMLYNFHFFLIAEAADE